jgi:hypothetical protein
MGVMAERPMGEMVERLREQVREMNLTKEEREACMEPGASGKGKETARKPAALKAETGQEIGAVMGSSVVVILDAEVKGCRVGRAKEGGWFLRVETRRGTFGSTGWPTAAAATGVMGLFLRTGYLVEKAAGNGNGK